MDEVLRNKVVKILEDEQKELDQAFDPQTGIESPKTRPVIENRVNTDGSVDQIERQEPTNFVNESVTVEYKKKIIEEAKLLQEFCKIVDDKILSFNSQINDRKREIVNLTKKATSGNCWPGAATSVGGAQTGYTIFYGGYSRLKEDIENIRIYPNMAGPDTRLDTENPFDPDAIYRLTSNYSGLGYKNLQDPIFIKNKDGTFTGLGTDGSGNLIGYGQFNISETLTDHQYRNLGSFMIYSGSGVKDPSVTPEVCVGIGTSIRILYNEIIEFRKQRDSLRENLNILKSDKLERELTAWGTLSVDYESVKRSVKNLSAISAVKSFDSNDLVNVEAIVLSLDVRNPDSYSGIGTTWYDGSGNSNHATLFPINSPATYQYADGYYLTFNGSDEYAQTVSKTSNVLGAGTTWTMETWFKVNGSPSNPSNLNIGFSTIVTALGYFQPATGIITGITTDNISVGQYVKEKVGILTGLIQVTEIGIGSVFIDPISENVGLASTSLSFGKFVNYTNAILDVNSSSTTTHMLSVPSSPDGIFSNVQTNRLVYTTSQTGVSTTHLVGTGITNGLWYHAVVVRNGTENTQLYINGNLVNTYTGDFPLGTASTTSTKIAAWSDENVYSNVGISAIKIYQKSITSEEVQKKFNATKNRFGRLG